MEIDYNLRFKISKFNSQSISKSIPFSDTVYTEAQHNVY